ncbi:MAG: hypothetical protein ACXWE7_10985 [Nitrososphaeraceae archaeon]
MWIRYQHKWSYGNSGDWNYCELNDDDRKYLSDDNDTGRELLDDITDTQRWTFSEQYRGYEWEIVEFPPIEILEKQIKRCELNIKSETRTLQSLRSQLNHLLQSKNDGTN